MLATDIVLYLGIALAISEALALIPKLKANSILTLILGILRTLVPKK